MDTTPIAEPMTSIISAPASTGMPSGGGGGGGGPPANTLEVNKTPAIVRKMMPDSLFITCKVCPEPKGSGLIN
jgi:hypothetical protein